jgi:ferredoxin--NADP+ reductase
VVQRRIDVTPRLIILRVAAEGWELPAFTPGQFVVLGLPGAAHRCPDADHEAPPLPPARLIRRAYSIASSSVSREYVELYISLVRSGSLSPRLFALEEGDRVWLGPRVSGTFTLDEVPAGKHVVMIATGTGLAPYMSMLRTELPDDGARRWCVLLGARHSCDLGYHAELETLARACPNLDYVPTISRPGQEPVEWRGAVGRVNHLWADGTVERLWGFAPTPENSRLLLCGNPDMIEDMCDTLAGEGFRRHSRREPGEVFMEKYW